MSLQAAGSIPSLCNHARLEGISSSRRVHGKRAFYSFPRMTRLILAIIAVRREVR